MTATTGNEVTTLRTSRHTPFGRSCLAAASILLAAMIVSPRPLAALAPAASGAKPLKLEYHLRLERPTTHLAEIEIDASRVTEPTLDFVIPAWSPGRYAIYDFAKNVQEFHAEGAEGQPLAWTAIDKQTWRVETANAGGTVRVDYRVFANDLSGTFSQIDDSHANLNGPSIYMYVAGHEPDPVSLTVDPPAGWKIFSGYTLATDLRTFTAPNYDRMVDTPMEIAPACHSEQFQDHGRTFRVVVHAYTPDGDAEVPKLVSQLTDGLRKIVASEMSMLPAPDFDHYTFLFHFAPDIAEGDGMEHLNSTEIIIRGVLSDDSIREAIETAAHEFFHTWNVKRLRPAALGPFEYTREDYTKSLWFAEGVTNYYAYVHLLRAGIWGRADFLGRLGIEISDLEREPARKLMSAESSSFHAWFYDRSPQMQETNFANSTISYYNKGALVGMLLDLEIRGKTGGAKSLDDVMRWLYQKFYEAPATTYYLLGRGYEESDIVEAVNAVAGSDFSTFFERYVRGTEPLPYGDALGRAGLELKISTTTGMPPSLGMLYQPIDAGVRITAVQPGGAADRAGLSRDDVLTAVGDLSLATEDLATRLRMYRAGAEVSLTVQRHGERSRIAVKLDPPEPDQYTIQNLKGATEEEIKIREEWLDGKQ